MVGDGGGGGGGSVSQLFRIDFINVCNFFFFVNSVWREYRFEFICLFVHIIIFFFLRNSGETEVQQIDR